MTSVFISTENECKDIMHLFSLLSRAARVSAFFKGFTNMMGNADFILLPLREGAMYAEPHCVAVVFDDSKAIEQLPNRCTVLCFCDKAAARCSGENRQLISCGMHNKDTVTLSSTEKGKPVLSVQRRLITFGGKEVEVGDFPLVTDEQDYRALMAASVLLLLSGKELGTRIFFDQSSTTEPVPFSM